MVTINDIKNHEEIKSYIEQADKVLGALGYTEHSFAHASKVSTSAGQILSQLGYDDHQCRLAEIAGYMHDMGNSVNRDDHAKSGAIMAYSILRDLKIPPKDVACIVSAIGNHDEDFSSPADEVAAALILADKSDIRKSRVRNRSFTIHDIHDRVNFSAKKSELVLKEQEKIIELQITIDTNTSSPMEYFEIFLNRMLLCKKAADVLKLKFQLVINNLQMF